MIDKLNIFLNKKILVYGLGKSGIASYKFLKGKSDVYLYDDFKSNIQAVYLKKKLINYSIMILHYQFKWIIEPINYYHRIY